MKYLGDYDASAVIYNKFTTFRPSTGASYTLAGSPAISVYKDNSTTQSTAGVTLTTDFDSVTGLNHYAIDTSADGTFYSAGSFFDIVITAGTVDSVSVVGAVVAGFTIRKNSSLKPTTAGRTLDVSTTGEAGLDWANIGSPTTSVNLSGTSTKALEPTTAGRTLDVSATGEAGIDWANIGSPTTAVNLSGTTVKTATDVEADTQDIQARIPTALTAGGNIKADALAISGDTVAADNAESFFDGTGYAGTNNVIPTVTTVGTVTTLTNLPPIPAGWLTATGIASDAFTAAKFAADVTTELQAGLALEATLTSMKGATFDTSTDSLEALRNRGDAVWVTATGFSTLDAAGVRSAVGLASANLDTQLAAIDTDTGNILTNLATVDTVADGIKAKTDSLTFTVLGQVDANIQYVNDVQVIGTGASGDEWGPV